MNFYGATLVELLIIELFVFCIWFKVLLDSIKTKDGSLAAKKLILTSIGLVLMSIAITGIMGYRIYEFGYPEASSLWAIAAAYIILAISGFILMLSASIGQSTMIIKLFAVVTIVWSAVAIWLAY